MLQLLNGEDAKVAPAVAEVLPALATLVDATVASLQAGGCVHYFGAGTSGRLAVLDAAELLPTFNAPEGLFTAHHAGGPAALLRAVENVEDDVEAGRAEAAGLRPGDIAVGLTASGRTPFVGGALAPGARAGRGHRPRDRQPAGRAGARRRPPARGQHRTGGHHRLHPAQGGHRPEARPQRLLDRGDDPPGAHLVQPHGRRGRHQRQAARPRAADPAGGERRRGGARRARRSSRPTASSSRPCSPCSRGSAPPSPARRSRSPTAPLPRPSRPSRTSTPIPPPRQENPHDHPIRMEARRHGHARQCPGPHRLRPLGRGLLRRRWQREQEDPDGVVVARGGRGRLQQDLRRLREVPRGHHRQLQAVQVDGVQQDPCHRPLRLGRPRHPAGALLRAAPDHRRVRRARAARRQGRPQRLGRHRAGQRQGQAGRQDLLGAARPPGHGHVLQQGPVREERPRASPPPGTSSWPPTPSSQRPG